VWLENAVQKKKAPDPPAAIDFSLLNGRIALLALFGESTPSPSRERHEVCSAMPKF
jgi:hypothetical protein